MMNLTLELLKAIYVVIVICILVYIVRTYAGA